MSLGGKKVAIILDFTYEDLEVLYPKIRLEEEGAVVTLVSLHAKGTKVTGKFGYPSIVDLHINDALLQAADFDCVICPGGFAPDYYRRDQKMKDFVAGAFKTGKVIGAICHGPWMLCSAKNPETGKPIVEGLKVTAFVAIKDDLENAGGKFVDEAVVCDGNVVTSRTPKDLTPFCLKLVERIKALN